jgi:hypothetical protein
MMTLISQLWKFMRVYQKFWLLPVVIGLLLVGALMIVAQSTAVGPFIYAIF